MASDVEVLSLLLNARRLGFASKPLEDMALMLVELYSREGDCVAFRVGWWSYLQELACLGVR